MDKRIDLPGNRRITVFDDDACVIAEADCWRPGVYEDRAAAAMAFGLEDEALVQLQAAANDHAGGVITLAMVQAALDGKEGVPGDDRCPSASPPAPSPLAPRRVAGSWCVSAVGRQQFRAEDRPVEFEHLDQLQQKRVRHCGAQFALGIGPLADLEPPRGLHLGQPRLLPGGLDSPAEFERGDMDARPVPPYRGGDDRLGTGH